MYITRLSIYDKTLPVVGKGRTIDILSSENVPLLVAAMYARIIAYYVDMSMQYLDI